MGSVKKSLVTGLLFGLVMSVPAHAVNEITSTYQTINSIYTNDTVSQTLSTSGLQYNMTDAAIVNPYYTTGAVDFGTSTDPIYLLYGGLEDFAFLQAKLSGIYGVSPYTIASTVLNSASQNAFVSVMNSLSRIVDTSQGTGVGTTAKTTEYVNGLPKETTTNTFASYTLPTLYTFVQGPTQDISKETNALASLQGQQTINETTLTNLKNMLNNVTNASTAYAGAISATTSLPKKTSDTTVASGSQGASVTVSGSALDLTNMSYKK